MKSLYQLQNQYDENLLLKEEISNLKYEYEILAVELKKVKQINQNKKNIDCIERFDLQSKSCNCQSIHNIDSSLLKNEIKSLEYINKKLTEENIIRKHELVKYKHEVINFINESELEINYLRDENKNLRYLINQKSPNDQNLRLTSPAHKEINSYLDKTNTIFNDVYNKFNSFIMSNQNTIKEMNNKEKENDTLLSNHIKYLNDEIELLTKDKNNLITINKNLETEIKHAKQNLYRTQLVLKQFEKENYNFQELCHSTNHSNEINKQKISKFNRLAYGNLTNEI